MTAPQYVAYYRVSTQRQGRSGLGLDAQRAAVEPWRGDIVAEFTEIESGKKSDRPELARALAACRERGATLLIAKLDRLARNLHFVSGLLESNVPIMAADMPEADRTFLQMAAVFAEWEGRKISERTRAALAAAKARGVKLGCPCPEKGGATTKRKRLAASASVAETALSVARPLLDRGASLREIAGALNGAGVLSAMGRRWHPASVARLIENHGG
jgi:DNA invertase Pin-like site-specific DNA recombinase